MSRSVHTDPWPIRAHRRAVAPRARRQAGDARRWLRPASPAPMRAEPQRQTRRAADPSWPHALAGAFAGSPPLAPPTEACAPDAGARRAAPPLTSAQRTPAPPGSERTLLSPRLTATRPRPGWQHPASTKDLAAVLRRLGPEATHGVRVITLARQPAGRGGAPRLGQLVVPGRIVLFEQLSGPWTLASALPADQVERLRCAGARVETLAGVQTVVTWPPGALRRFLLQQVLLHELAHHRLQHTAGKRAARVRRTADHERAAERLAARWRRRLAVDIAEGDQTTWPEWPVGGGASAGQRRARALVGADRWRLPEED